MGEQPEKNGAVGRYLVPGCAAARDTVDGLLLSWESERPDLDFSPLGVITRLARLRSHFDVELAGVFADFGLTQADFLVIITLRRSGGSFTMPQARLMEAMGLTSGTVSVRLDRLERSGVVTRTPDPGSPRGSLVHLTAKGQRLFDDVAPMHLRNEDRLLSALTAAERDVLADLLRRLLVSFESETSDVAADLGLILEPAHLARARRLAVGLSDAAGMLIARVLPGSPAEAAGIERGDLLTAVDGTPATGSAALAGRLGDRDVGGAGCELTLLRGERSFTVTVGLQR